MQFNKTHRTVIKNALIIRNYTKQEKTELPGSRENQDQENDKLLSIKKKEKHDLTKPSNMWSRFLFLNNLNVFNWGP